MVSLVTVTVVRPLYARFATSLPLLSILAWLCLLFCWYPFLKRSFYRLWLQILGLQPLNVTALTVPTSLLATVPVNVPDITLA